MAGVTAELCQPSFLDGGLGPVSRAFTLASRERFSRLFRQVRSAVRQSRNTLRGATFRRVRASGWWRLLTLALSVLKADLVGRAFPGGRGTPIDQPFTMVVAVPHRRGVAHDNCTITQSVDIHFGG